MRKIVLPGLVAGLAMLAIGLAASFLIDPILPGIKNEYANSKLFRPWSDPLMQLYYLHPIIVGLILAWVWDKVKPIFHECRLKKSVCLCRCCCGFGFMYWIMATIPGMFITYASFQVSLPMVLNWSLVSLLQALAAGAVLAKMNKV